MLYSVAGGTDDELHFGIHNYTRAYGDYLEPGKRSQSAGKSGLHSDFGVGYRRVRDSYGLRRQTTIIVH